MKFKFKTEKYYHNNTKMKTEKGLLFIVLGLILLAPILYTLFWVGTNYNTAVNDFWNEPSYEYPDTEYVYKESGNQVTDKDPEVEAQLAKLIQDYEKKKKTYLGVQTTYTASSMGQHSYEKFEKWVESYSGLVQSYNDMVSEYNSFDYYVSSEFEQLLDKEMLVLNSEEQLLTNMRNIRSEITYDCTQQCIAEFGDNNGYYLEDSTRKVGVTTTDMYSHIICICEDAKGEYYYEIEYPITHTS